MEAPKMTYYVRIRSNLTNQILTNWKFFDASLWYYGKINTNFGGESEYIVELDIWNNEPAFNAGDFNTRNKDAYNCKLGIEPLSDDLTLFKIDPAFLYGRCCSTHKLEEWTPISLNEPLTHIYGTNNPNNIGVLIGNADHCLIQTKLILPKMDLQSHQRYPFKLTFHYLYD